MAPLPKWLTEVLPQIEPHYVATLTDDKKILVVSPEDEKFIFETVEEFYEIFNHKPIAIGQEILDHFNGKDSVLLTFKSKVSGFNTLFVSITDIERMRILENDYENFLKNAKSWREDPTSFLNSYYYVDTHPAFWTRSEADSWSWQTSGHCGKIYQMVWGPDEKNPEVTVGLETGSHVGPEGAKKEYGYPDKYVTYSEHYHDWRLDSYGRTFEEAYVELAKKVFMAFDNEGNDLPNSDDYFDKPEWVSTVEERIKEHRENKPNDEEK